MSRSLHDPEGMRLPIKLDSTSNGEFAPVPLEPIHHHARDLAFADATINARRLGESRRDFLVSLCGAATTLLAMNTAFLAGCKRGASYAVPPEAALEPEAAASALAGNEFIFDVQGHFVNPAGAWTRSLPPGSRPLQMPKTEACGPSKGPGERAYLQCIGADEFVKDVFLDSDTDLMVLSFVPSRRNAEPLTIEEAVETARIVEKLDGTHRLFIHGRVNPNQPGDLEGMRNTWSSWRERCRTTATRSRSTWSPTACPNPSLTALKWSTSMMSTDASARVRRCRSSACARATSICRRLNAPVSGSTSDCSSSRPCIASSTLRMMFTVMRQKASDSAKRSTVPPSSCRDMRRRAWSRAA